MGALTRVVVVEVIWSFTNSGCVPKILLINLDFDMLWKDVRDKEESGIIVQIDELRKSSSCFFFSSSSSFLVWLHYLAFFCFCCCSLFFSVCLFWWGGGECLFTELETESSTDELLNSVVFIWEVRGMIKNNGCACWVRGKHVSWRYKSALSVYRWY